MRKIVHDTVVIGRRLDAVIYSFLNNLPLLLVDFKKPSCIEYLTPTNAAVLSDLPSGELKGRHSTKTRGPSQLAVWNRLCFLLSLDGKLPLADKISSIRISEEEKKIKVITHNSRSIIIHCNQVIIFDDKNINGLPRPVRLAGDHTKRKVLDWINVRSGMVHKYDWLDGDTDFVNSVHFYPSDRIDGEHDKRDMVVISYLTKEELNDIHYSDLFVRFKALDIMKEAGIRGRRNGKDTNNPEKYKYYAIKLEMNKREVDLEEKNLYNDTPFIKFKYETMEELLKNVRTLPTSLFKLYSRLKGVV